MSGAPSAGRAGVVRRRQLYLEAAVLLADRRGEDLSLDEVARELATSSRQLQRAFSENADTGFRAYLTRLRMQQAAELLREGGTPVDRVGQTVAYRGAGAFSKAFRRTYGLTPSEYRRASSTATRPYPPTRVETGWTRASRVLVGLTGLAESSTSSNTGGEQWKHKE